METNNTDKYYKEALAGYEYRLSGNAVWRKLKWRLFWLDFRYYIIGVGALAMLGAALFFALSAPQSNEITEPLSLSGQVSHIHHATVEQNKAGDEADDEASDEHAAIMPNPEVSETVSAHAGETKEPAMTRPAVGNSNAPDGNNVGEIIFEKPSAIATLVVREKAMVNPMHSASAGEINPLNPGSLSDSVRQYHIPHKRVSLSLALHVSPAYQNFDIQAASGYEANQNYRKNNEHPSFSISAGIDLQLNIRNWYIQTGLAYSKLRNYRNYNHTFLAYDSLSSYFTNDTIWGWVYDPPDLGKPIIIGIDTLWVPVYNDINEGYNEWNYLEIPLLIGYKFNKHRFSFDVATGLSYGWLLNATGNVPSLTQDNVFTELTDMDNTLNRNQFNYILQIGFSYHLTPAWSIMAKPYYRQNLRSVFFDSYPVNQRFRSFGIHFGLTVDL